MFHQTKKKTKQNEQLDLKKKTKQNRKSFQPVGGEKKRKTMSDMSSIQKRSHLVFQDVLGLSSLVFPLEMSQAVYEGRQQLDIHILHTETDEEGGGGCVDVTQCICVYSYIFRGRGDT